MEIQPNNINNNEPVREAVVENKDKEFEIKDKEFNDIMNEYWDKDKMIKFKEESLRVIRNNIEQMNASKERTLAEIENLKREKNRLKVERESLERRTANKDLKNLKGDKILNLLNKTHPSIGKWLKIDKLDYNIKNLLKDKIIPLEEQQGRGETVEEDYKNNLYEKYNGYIEALKSTADELTNELTRAKG